MIRRILVLLLTVVVVAEAGNLRTATDGVLDCKKVNCDSLRFSDASSHQSFGVVLSLRARPHPNSSSLFADDGWPRVYAILRALAEHDPAFTDEVLKREDATYYYRNGRTLGVAP